MYIVNEKSVFHKVMVLAVVAVVSIFLLLASMTYAQTTENDDLNEEDTEMTTDNNDSDTEAEDTTANDDESDEVHEDDEDTTSEPTTTDVSEMMELLQSLMAQVRELQAQLAEARGEVQELREQIVTELREGQRGDEVTKLQELLSSDPDIYPERLVTGFFGPLTRQAVMRFQQRHNVSESGELDQDTRELINSYFAERTGRTDAPEGILRAPGVRQAVERGVCQRGQGNRPFCPTENELEEDEDNQSTSPSHSQDEEDEVLTTCGLSEFEDLVGTEVDRDQIIADWEAYHDAEAGIHGVRILGENDPMTMDYRETRLNVVYDEDEVIVRVFCG